MELSIRKRILLVTRSIGVCACLSPNCVRLRNASVSLIFDQCVAQSNDRPIEGSNFEQIWGANHEAMDLNVSP